MALKFTPPKSEMLPRYASYGSGQMKTHTSLGAAKQSLGHRCGVYNWNRDQGWKEGFILELVDGEWYTLFHVKEGTKDNDLPWKKEYLDDSHSYYGRRFLIDGLSDHSIKYYEEKGAKRVKMSTPMSKDEYASWRVAVELEKRGIEA